MLAYNKEKLDKLAIQEDADIAYRLKAITEAEKQAIDNAFTPGFYTPHFAIRIGLFVLTTVVALCALGFLSVFVFMGGSSESAFRGILVFSGMLAYAGMEFYIWMGHYRSGVDDALLWASTGMLLCGITPLEHDMETALFLISFVIAAVATLRTGDTFMAVVCYLSLLGFIFFSLHESPTGQSSLPLIIMVISAITYLLMRYLRHKPALRHYRPIFPWMLTVSLLTFYIAGNYAVAAALTENPYEDKVPGAPLFWTFTIAVPLLYLFLGIRFKDAILLRTGLGLVAAAVLTVRAYHHFLPTEWMLVIAGIALVFISYMLIRYLKTPKHGFSDEPDVDASRFTKLQLESLIITQSVQAPAAPQNHFDFGGGSGGGGGAGGTF